MITFNAPSSIYTEWDGQLTAFCGLLLFKPLELLRILPISFLENYYQSQPYIWFPQVIRPYILSFFFLNLLIYLFLAVLGPRLHAVRGPLTIAASPAAAHRLQMRRLSSRGSRAQPLRGTRDPPRPGLEPASPALAGRLPTTAPPGKPIY